ncbi:MAG: hypothetical protein IPJ56_09110 [Gemmatimonadetes bacterium]|nr:hypothetical protein [Gemmatimonadota bacterium]
MLDLDYVHLRLSTRRERHVVELNGQDFGGFRKSNLKFLRLLLLATARKYGPDDGWLDKSRLRDDSDKDPALNDLRADLGKYDLYGLGEEERKALIRVQRGTGLIRLGVPPENITLDASLAELTFVATTTTVKKDGTKTKPPQKQEEGWGRHARSRDCRRSARLEKSRTRRPRRLRVVVAVAPLKFSRNPPPLPGLGCREVVGGDDLGLLEVDQHRAPTPAVEGDTLALGLDEAALLLALGDQAPELLQVDHLAVVVDALAVGTERVVRALEVEREAPLVEDVVDLVLEVPLHGHHAQHRGSDRGVPHAGDRFRARRRAPR